MIAPYREKEQISCRKDEKRNNRGQMEHHTKIFYFKRSEMDFGRLENWMGGSGVHDFFPHILNYICG